MFTLMRSRSIDKSFIFIRRGRRERGERRKRKRKRVKDWEREVDCQ